MTTLMSVKNTGLSGNIIKFLITYGLCERLGFHLVFPCDLNTKQILQRFTHVDKSQVTFVEYSVEHKSLFNEKSRRNCGVEYPTAYKEYIRKTYFDNKPVEFDYLYGNENTVERFVGNKKNSSVIEFPPNNTILLDYNDGIDGYRKSLTNLYGIVGFNEIDDVSYVFRRTTKTFSFNLKTTTPERFERELNYWSVVVSRFLSDYGGDVFFVSGNKEMKREMCRRFGVPFLDFETENKQSNREGGELQRGSATSAIVDIQNCVNTNFIPIERLVREYGITSVKPGELFRAGKAEKFDLLVEFMREGHVLPLQ